MATESPTTNLGSTSQVGLAIRPAGETHAVGAVDPPPEAEVQRRMSKRFVLFNAMPSWLISMLIHTLALLVLATISIEGTESSKVTVLNVASASQEVDRFDLLETQEAIQTLDAGELSSEAVLTPEASDVPPEVTQVGVSTDVDAAPLAVDFSDVGEATAPRGNLLQELGVMGGTGLQGRGAAMRIQMVSKNGGTKGSEEAVAMALQWFAEHQLQDGSWSFDHRGGRCAGRCSSPGDLKECYTGATAMALLPFLGAGQTHKEGPYQANVGAGLAFLVRSMAANGSLVQSGGNMYAHGLASITLCEAYAMTEDRQLLAPAQAALNFIAYAQDPIGGGWRYVPRQAGDTSVVGWQLMALKSGHMAYLSVHPKTILGVTKFLDMVQTDGGAKYGYNVPGGRASTTAVGLLCRMYLGWKREQEPLKRGVEFLAKTGPSRQDMYFNYYATQVMRHFGGEPWDKWNAVMRDQLVNSQSKSGHAKGSWDVLGVAHANRTGGRLYFTSMATMILEVYYRHMPIYRTQAAEEEFPL